jgi:hypothetical protein
MTTARGLPLTNASKAIRFRNQTLEARKAKARETRTPKNAPTLPPPDEYDAQAEEAEEKDKLRVRARAKSRKMGCGLTHSVPLTNTQKRAFLVKKKKASAEKERKGQLAGEAGAGVDGNDVGAWVKATPYPGSIEEAIVNSAVDSNKAKVKCGARAPGPGVVNVLRSQGKPSMPIRSEPKGDA